MCSLDAAEINSNPIQSLLTTAEYHCIKFMTTRASLLYMQAALAAALTGWCCCHHVSLLLQQS
jgi:hypothetical protein